MDVDLADAGKMLRAVQPNEILGLIIEEGMNWMVDKQLHDFLCMYQ